jgi:hypothetical protein
MPLADDRHKGRVEPIEQSMEKTGVVSDASPAGVFASCLKRTRPEPIVNSQGGTHVRYESVY